MKYKYRNPWFDPDRLGHGRALFETDRAPVEYRGFQIFHPHAGCFQLVKDQVCLTERAGKRGCYSLADALLGDDSGEPLWLVERAQEIAKQYKITFKQAA